MNSSSFFCNRECEFYPCHETSMTLNCLFCFCPLYSLTDCGGHFTFTDMGVKDCSKCLLPHQPGGYGFVIKRLMPVERTEDTDGTDDSTGLAGR